MKSIKYIILIIISTVLMLTISSCKVGSDSFQEPWEINSNFVYSVVYEGMGGTINTLSSRTVWYAGDSLLKEPGGAYGMLVKPVKGNLVVLGWYTSYENVGTDQEPVYEYKEEDRWDFNNDRINESNTDENKQLTLYARWIDSPSIYFLDADNTENVLLKWQNVDVTQTLSRPSTTEKVTIQKDNKTFTLLDYFYDKELTQKVIWGDGSRSVEEIIASQDGDSGVYIYCKYIEGEYTRIKSITDIKNIDNFNGNCILANDIDAENANWTPLRNKNDDPFTGIFIGNGYTISNINITATNKVSGVASAGAKEKSYGLFGLLSGATFKGFNFKNVTINIGNTSNVDLCTGVFGGRATGTTFENCSIQGFTVISDGQVKVKVYLGKAAYLDETCTVTDSNFDEPVTEGLEINSENLITGDQTPVID
ncbi:MAG: hypothetical protein A2Y15_09410 [Clostridiales bacterium GWF2_36_10]|nr:MAG: hypothetical protein A2Y15_09410 [Clostridiales bacterium GWF2_36_10]HAN21404.1 hypothetical protein [Clostridiales bacterium]